MLLIETNIEMQRRERILINLYNTWDNWVKENIARNLHLLVGEDSNLLIKIGQSLLNDSSQIIRRATIVSMVHFSFMADRPNMDILHFISDIVKKDRDYGVKLKFVWTIKNYSEKYPIVSEIIETVA